MYDSRLNVFAVMFQEDFTLSFEGSLATRARPFDHQCEFFVLFPLCVTVLCVMDSLRSRKLIRISSATKTQVNIGSYLFLCFPVQSSSLRTLLVACAFFCGDFGNVVHSRGVSTTVPHFPFALVLSQRQPPANQSPSHRPRVYRLSYTHDWFRGTTRGMRTHGRHFVDGHGSCIFQHYKIERFRPSFLHLTFIFVSVNPLLWYRVKHCSCTFCRRCFFIFSCCAPGVSRMARRTKQRRHCGCPFPFYWI